MCFFYNCWEQPCADQNAGRWTRQVMKVRSSQFDFSWKKTIWWDRGRILLFCNTSTNRLTECYLIWTSTIKGVWRLKGEKCFTLISVKFSPFLTMATHCYNLHIKHTHIHSIMSPVSSKDSKVTITVYYLTLLHRLLKHIWLYIIISIYIIYNDMLSYYDYISLYQYSFFMCRSYFLNHNRNTRGVAYL